MLHKFGIFIAVVAFICGVGIIVFSCIDIPGSELAMAIFGIVLMIMALLYMFYYNRERKEVIKNKRNERTPK